MSGPKIGKKLSKRGKGNVYHDPNMSSLNSQIGPAPRRTSKYEVIERSMPGFARPRYRCPLRYYDELSLSTGAGSAGTYVYSANGLYDVDITSTGHQPMRFDEMMIAFEHYCVVGARMHISIRNASTTNTIGFSISANAGPTPTTNIIQLVENGLMVRDRLAVSPASESVRALEFPIDIAKFGTVPSLLSNPDYAGSVASNPAEQSYFHISVWCPDGVSTVSGLTVEVTIDYDAVFFEPRKSSVSLRAAVSKLILQEEKLKRGERKD